ncbi:MAG TPA: ABC transporter substrate-binding protein [Gemmatimonadaceae bacterium]
MFALQSIAPAMYGQSSPQKSLRIGVLTAARRSSASMSIERGLQLGAAEANQTALLFGNDIQLFESPASTDAVTSARKLLSQRKVQIIIASSADDADALSALAEREHVLFLNVASRSPALRAACRRNTFHIEASESTYSAAASFAAQSAAVRAPGSAPTPRVDSTVLWSPTLERYGASQINQRFHARYGSGMDGSAWAGWAAVKIISESFLRAQSSDAWKLIAYLQSPGTSFDGHKGWPLSFRTADHQLRQPLYVATRDSPGARVETIRDVPELRGSGSAGAVGGGAQLNAVLDRITPLMPAGGCGRAR